MGNHIEETYGEGMHMKICATSISFFEFRDLTLDSKSDAILLICVRSVSK